MTYRLTFLGTGTSHGIPVIGCKCDTCTSINPKNKRYRSSVLFSMNNRNLLIDTTPEFRLQALRSDICDLDAVLYTHTHADHLNGIDDLRVFTRDKNLPIYGSSLTIDRIEKRFDYVLKDKKEDYTSIPHLFSNVLTPYKKYNIAGFEVIPLVINHGKLPIFGYRINNVAYLTDTNNIPDLTMNYLDNLDLLVLVALQHKVHKTHYNFKQAVEVAKTVGARRTLFTHIAHGIEHERDNAILPDNMELAYDGMELIFEEN